MKNRIFHEFLKNYVVVFLMSLLAAIFVFVFLSFAGSIISKNLMKNVYSADSIMKDDYRDIETGSVIENGGGVQVVNSKYQVVYSEGIDAIGKRHLTAEEFTDFLVQSKGKGVPYHYDIKYSSKGDFWLIVTFPTSIRLDFSLVYNNEAESKDMKLVAIVFAVGIVLYLLLLAAFAVIFSRVTSVRITKPLQKLCEGTQRLREGDYSVRVELGLTNEFAQLQDTFNDMAVRIEEETALRKQSEEERKRMLLDISHDLKNPLSSVAGYAELCLKRYEADNETIRPYLEIIHKNSQRASHLLTQLFEMSQLESPFFSLKLCKTDICEYLRQVCGELLPSLEQAGIVYNFEIPEYEVYSMIDEVQMNRVFHNLAENAVRYNPEGTILSVSLTEKDGCAYVEIKDNGIGIPSAVARDIFKPFVRVDDSRNSGTGGTGLGLSIAKRIVEAHGGKLVLNTDTGLGCTFFIVIPIIQDSFSC